MRLCAFEAGGDLRTGVIDGEAVIDMGPAGPDGLRGLLAGGPAALSRLTEGQGARPTRPLTEIRLRAPFPAPRNFLAVGLNYRAHARDMGRPIPDRPACFSKLSGAVAGPGDTVVRPAGFSTLDYEGELGVVIGRRCRSVPRTEAMDVVAGYVIVNDFSIREILAPDRLALAKGCDGFAPVGPWLTTADAVDVAEGLRLRTWVDDELRQDASTGDMIFGIDELIEVFSHGVTLHPGDIISTGSPGGSANAFAPPRYLQPGQSVVVEIAGLGRLSNIIQAETA